MRVLLIFSDFVVSICLSFSWIVAGVSAGCRTVCVFMVYLPFLEKMCWLLHDIHEFLERRYYSA